MTTDLISTTIPAVFCQIRCVKPCPSIIYWSTTSLTFVVAYGYFFGQSLVLSLPFFHLTPLQDKRITMIIYVNKVNKKIAKRIIIYIYYYLYSDHKFLVSILLFKETKYAGGTNQKLLFAALFLSAEIIHKVS